MREKNYKKQYEEKFDYGEQMPPSNYELEGAVLGAIMLESYSIDTYIAEFTPNIFYKSDNKIIAKAIIGLHKQGLAIDILTVTQELKKEGKLDEVGGAYYITTLTSRVASASNLGFHIKILQQEALRRNMLTICSKTIQDSFNDGVDVFDLYAETQTALDECIKDVLHYEVSNVKDIHIRNINESIEVLNSGGASGVRSGLRAVDELTSGWQKSDLIILAGRPSMGKTAAAVSMGIYPALADNKAIAIFSLEMSKEQLTGRIESWISGIDVSRIIKKQLTRDEIDEMDKRCSQLYNAPIYIDDTPNISLIELKSKARRLVKENKVELIIIDYLQLMRSGLNVGNREQEIAEISRGLKGLAKELAIPVIALSQLSRVVESRADKKPMLSDLRESGQIEQDADMVIFCYRPEYYGAETYEVGSESFNATGLFMLIVEKHRNGELGEIPLAFIHNQTKLKNYDFVREEELEGATFTKKLDSTQSTFTDDHPF